TVDRLEPAGRHQPGPRIARDSVARPLFQRGAKRIVRRPFGRVEAAERAEGGGDGAPGFRGIDRVSGLEHRVGRGHNQPITPSSTVACNGLKEAGSGWGQRSCGRYCWTVLAMETILWRWRNLQVLRDDQPSAKELAVV